MGMVELARRQWSDYHLAHASRRNLRIHLVAVPLFVLGNVLLLDGIIRPIVAASTGTYEASDWWMWLVAIAGMGLSAGAMAWQGAGHKQEQVAPKPFTGVGNVFGRIFLEQWFTFWRFLLTGGFGKAWKAAK